MNIPNTICNNDRITNKFSSNHVWWLKISKIKLLKLVYLILISCLTLQAIDYTKIWKTGNAQQIKVAIKEGADVNKFDHNGCTPLMFAAETNKNPEVISILVNAGADVDAKMNKSGSTPLLLALEFNNSKIALKLLNSGADTNLSNNFGNTPLMLASAFQSDENLVKSLINTNENINNQDRRGRSALWWAAENNKSSNIIKLLMTSGADASVINEEGKSPFMRAIENNSAEIVETMIKMGVNPNNNLKGKNLKGYMPMDFPFLDNIDTDNSPDNDKAGIPPLMWAVIKRPNDASIFAALIKNGADFNKTIDAKQYENLDEILQKVTISEIVYKYGKSQEFLKYVKNENANSVNTYINGRTPLMLAIINKHYDIAKNILKTNCNVNALDEDGNTALHVLMQQGYDISAHRSWATAISNKVNHECISLAKLLLHAGVNVNHQNSNGETPLILACKKGNPTNRKIIFELISANANINIHDSEGNTPLMYAIKTDSGDEYPPDIALALLNKKAEVNVKNNTKGETPLLLSIEQLATAPQIYIQEFNELIKSIIQAGANVNIENNEMISPFILAIRSSRNQELFNILLHAGIDTTQTTPEGRSLLEEARYCSNSIAITELIKAGVKK